jgi:hypothetical protein
MTDRDATPLLNTASHNLLAETCKHRNVAVETEANEGNEAGTIPVNHPQAGGRRRMCQNTTLLASDSAPLGPCVSALNSPSYRQNFPRARASAVR